MTTQPVSVFNVQESKKLLTVFNEMATFSKMLRVLMESDTARPGALEFSQMLQVMVDRTTALHEKLVGFGAPIAAPGYTVITAQPPVADAIADLGRVTDLVLKNVERIYDRDTIRAAYLKAARQEKLDAHPDHVPTPAERTNILKKAGSPALALLVA